MSDKPRVLFATEASFLSTGYSIYTREVMMRLLRRGDLELAELGCYGSNNDQRAQQVPWRFYGNLPTNDQETQQYNNNPNAQFGEGKFEFIVNDFKPTHILSIRDPWMSSHELHSPLREFYNYIYMPTIDAQPQMDRWMADIISADAVFTYSEWAGDLLKREAAGKVNYLGTASPGANLKDFSIPPNRKMHREQMGLISDNLIVGTVMRNQKRKMYPALMKSFRQFLDQAPEQLKNKTYLYLHTSYPDAGWDIPALLKEFGLAHRVIMTYMCTGCGLVKPGFYSEPRTICQKCGQNLLQFPNSQYGIPPEMLGKIVSTFDVYVQYALAEGFGMSVPEAAACGVPTMVVDYSAMCDFPKTLKSIPIKVRSWFREAETNRDFAIPDDDDFVQKLTDFLLLTPAKRRRLGFETRLGAEKSYSWDQTAAKWADAIFSLKPKANWAQPPRFHQPVTQVPEGIGDEAFVNWCLMYVAGRPDLINTYTAQRLTRDVMWGSTQALMGGLYYSDHSAAGMQDKFRPFCRQSVLDICVGLCNNKNYWESARTGVPIQ